MSLGSLYRLAMFSYFHMCKCPALFCAEIVVTVSDNNYSSQVKLASGHCFAFITQCTIYASGRVNADLLVAAF